MNTERDYYVGIGMPESVAARQEIFRPHSVGVLMHTGHLELNERRMHGGGEPSVLLVRQADQNTGGFHPWGIPAGRSEEGEGIFETASREVMQETGIQIARELLRWFCPVGKNNAVLSYRVEDYEIPNLDKARLHQLGIRVFPPHDNVDQKEIDLAALVPIEVFGDHMLTGPRHVYRQVNLKHQYLYYPHSHAVDEDIDFVPIMYKGKILQAIRHQMLVRKIIPDY